MNQPQKLKLESIIKSDAPLLEVVEELRGLKDQGVTKEEVYNTLELLRASSPNEETEDRILEVMDFVTGFCRAEVRIW